MELRVDEEFKDIPISDVEITFTVVTKGDGRPSYSAAFSIHNRSRYPSMASGRSTKGYRWA